MLFNDVIIYFTFISFVKIEITYFDENLALNSRIKPPPSPQPLLFIIYYYYFGGEFSQLNDYLWGNELEK
jgi:hypothetical protein